MIRSSLLLLYPCQRVNAGSIMVNRSWTSKLLRCGIEYFGDSAIAHVITAELCSTLCYRVIGQRRAHQYICIRLSMTPTSSLHKAIPALPAIKYG